jgi:hypothetical protein
MRRSAFAVLSAAALAGTGACAIDIPDVVSGDAGPDVAPPTTCAAAQCVPAAPAGWTGPLAFASVASPSTAPACPTNFAPALSAHTGLVPIPGTCSSCTCSVSSSYCEIAGANVYSNDSCTQFLQTSTVSTNACTAVGGSGTVMATDLGLTATAKATCASGGGVLQPGATAWSADVVACKAPDAALVQANCPGGDVCAPSAGAPFASKACVMQAGDVACPAAYSQKQLVYGSFADAEACSACSCSASPSKNTCSGFPSIAFFPDDKCAQTSVDTYAAGQCISTGSTDQAMSMELVDVSPPSVTCAAGQSTLSGSVSAVDPTTVCCLP